MPASATSRLIPGDSHLGPAQGKIMVHEQGGGTSCMKGAGRITGRRNRPSELRGGAGWRDEKGPAKNDYGD